MTDEKQGMPDDAKLAPDAAAEPVDSSGPTAEQLLHAAPDRSLVKLVTLANVMGEGTRIPLVLVVQGQVVGGQLIGGRQWFRQVREQMVAAGGAHGEVLRGIFAQEDA